MQQSFTNLSSGISPCRWISKLYPSTVWSSRIVRTNAISSKYTFGKLYSGAYAERIHLYIHADKVNTQCIPEAANFFNFSKYTLYVPSISTLILIVLTFSDVFSFYKEVLEGDTGNYISVRARSQGISAITALQQLVDEATKSHMQVCKILEIDQVALDIWMKYMYGNAAFHLSCDRYRLLELMK